MWLLKFHIAFSLLCQLSFIGVVVAFKDRLRRFQTEPKGKKKKYAGQNIAGLHPSGFHQCPCREKTFDDIQNHL